MAILLGSAGIVEITRASEGEFTSILDAADINITERRFSFDFPNGTFVTGDRLQIRRLNPDDTPSNLPLDFIAPTAWADGKQHPDGSWFVNVDAIGGLHLFTTWSAALAGRPGVAKQLQIPSASYKIGVSLANHSPRCLAQIQEFSINTSRSTIDVTALGDAFAQQWSGLISAEGEVTCFWDWYPTVCGETDVERAQYMHQLILRQQIGSEFKGRFVLKRRGISPIDDASRDNEEIWYECNCIITSAGLAFSPAEPLSSTIQFVVNGEMMLKSSRTESSGDLLLEDGSYLDMEDGERIAE